MASNPQQNGAHALPDAVVACETSSAQGGVNGPGTDGVDRVGEVPGEVRGADYERAQRRRCLYRVLANSLVRELREAGYHGEELLGFASEVMQAINDNGWDHEAAGAVAVWEAEKAEGAAGGNGRVRRPAPRSWLTHDAQGRPVLFGEKVFLRMPLAEDASALGRWRTDARVQASLIPVVLEHVLGELRAGASFGPPEKGNGVDRVDLIVCAQAGESPIGLVSLHDMDWRVGQAALGKMIGEEAYRGQGMGRDATQLILRYGFETLEMNRIYLRTLGGNLKNIRLNERMGFRFEGVLQQAAFSEGARTDIVMMAMLRSEFEVQ